MTVDYGQHDGRNARRAFLSGCYCSRAARVACAANYRNLTA
jgi:hypothetical protein